MGQRRPLVVINRFDPKGGLSVDRIQGFLPGCDICTLAKDRAVIESMNSGQPLRLYSQRSRALADMDAMLRKIHPDAQESGSRDIHKSMLSRLGHALCLS